MDIKVNKEGVKLSIALTGRLDTMTAPELDKAINDNVTGVEELVIDLSGLEYISSAGLRVLLSAQKKMAPLGGMTVKHPNEIVSEVFEVTGFSDVLTIVE